MSTPAEEPQVTDQSSPAPKPPGNLIPFRKGYDPRRASGDALRRGGRHPAAVRRWAREQLLDPQVQAEIAAIVRDRNSPHFASTLGLLFKYGLGDPVRELRLTGLAAIAVRLEEMTRDELDHLATAPVEELRRLLPVPEGESD